MGLVFMSQKDLVVESRVRCGLQWGEGRGSPLRRAVPCLALHPGTECRPFPHNRCSGNVTEQISDKETDDCVHPLQRWEARQQEGGCSGNQLGPRSMT